VIGTDIQAAIQYLSQGAVVAIPTETVYGLAANALDINAVTRVFEVKNRPSFDPLIVHIADINALDSLVLSTPEPLMQLAQRFWPGPLTLLLPKKALVPDLVTSGSERVAIRIPNHPLTLALLQALDFPLAAPSANPFGYISPTTAQHVQDQLGLAVPYILDGGPCQVGLESTIVGMEDNIPVVYRKGGLSVEAIESLIGPVKVMAQSSSRPEAPGMLHSHYAPRKRLYLGDIDTLLNNFQGNKLGILTFNHLVQQNETNYVLDLSPSGDLSEAARNLFGYLRTLDQQAVDFIIASKVPDHGLGKAINDRLTRAAFIA
jgi:L-threonylcarbamoyladenylate synthase